MNMQASRAKIFFVGAGPGTADLITLRGARALSRAGVVLHDALTDPELRSLAPQAHWIDVGKRGFCDAMGQTRINALLVQHGLKAIEASAGRDASPHEVVVRLKGGDPSVFGRLEEELSALWSAGIQPDDVEVVPGITAALAAAAATQRPLTRRGHGRTVSLTTAMTQAGELQAPRTADTQVYYMAGRQLGALSRRLREAGWPAHTSVNVVSRAGWPDALSSDHQVQSLAEASLLHSGRPTVVCVGIGSTPLRRPPSAGTVAGAPVLAQADPASTSDSVKTRITSS